MWQSTVDGRRLHFHLAGINNQNFIMRDEETGSWWQQVTGLAIQGPMKGKRLAPVLHDEIAFATWRQEHPNGRVLQPDPAIARKNKYASANWEKEIDRLPVVTKLTDKRLAPRAIVAGITIGDHARAYPLDALRKQSPIVDTLGGAPIVLAMEKDGHSLRAFDRRVDGTLLDLYAKPGAPFTLVDTQTGSEWNFQGMAISGPMKGRRLTQQSLLLDYWFDWKTYHPDTSLYTLGQG